MRMGKREETVRNFGRGKNSGARKGSDGERRFRSEERRVGKECRL